MKHTILGFSQRKSVELGLELKHLMVLRWFVDFKDSGEMIVKIFEDDKYYWVKYDGLIRDLPILKTTTEDTIYRYLKKLVKSNVLKHRVLKQSGVWSFYTLGDTYKELIDDRFSIGFKSEPSGNISEPIGFKSEGNGQKIGTNNYSINNNKIYSRVVDKLNALTGKEYKSTTSKTKSLIQARVNEGFKEEDFYKVIEVKTEQWKSTDMEKYLRPETLFSNKFEGYLNEVKKSKKKEFVEEDNCFYPKLEFEHYE